MRHTDERGNLVAARSKIAKRMRKIHKLPSVLGIHALKGHLAMAAQKEYDDWQQDEEGMDEECGGGGICDRISAAMGDVLSKHGYDVASGGQQGDDHAWNLVNTREGVHEIDIPPDVYETGGGYSWTKKPNVKFGSHHIYINKIDHPHSAEEFAEKYSKGDY